MSICNTKTVKLFLSGIFSLTIAVFSHASERVIYYAHAVIYYSYISTGLAVPVSQQRRHDYQTIIYQLKKVIQ